MLAHSKEQRLPLNVSNPLVELDNPHSLTGPTPLYLAMFEGHHHVMSILIEHKADLNIKYCGLTLLQAAMRKDWTVVIQHLLESRADPDSSDSEQTTPLMIAAKHGSNLLTRLLLEAGANVDAYDPKGKTTLSYALFARAEDVVRTLAKCGDSTGVMIDDGIKLTPLMFAAKHGWQSLTETLLGAGASLDEQDPAGCTALAYAVNAGADGTVRTLIQSGASLELSANYSQRKLFAATSLMIAAHKGLNYTVRLLLDAGANANAQDGNGITAIFYAICADAIRSDVDDVVRSSQERGASLGAMDQKANFILSRNWEGLQDLMSWDPRFKSVMPALREAELNADETIRDLAKACWTLYEVTQASAFYSQINGSHTSL